MIMIDLHMDFVFMTRSVQLNSNLKMISHLKNMLHVFCWDFSV